MKRINVKLVAGLAIGLVVFMALTVGLHEFQSNRRADGLLVRAKDLQEQGEYGDAIRLIGNYLRRRPDDKSQYGNLALTMKKMIDQNDEDGKPLDPNIVRSAFGSLEQALRENPEDLEIRDAAVEFDIRFARFSDAIVHLEYLIKTEERKDDSDLRVKLAQCYFRSGKEEDAKALLQQLIGFDEASRGFRVDQALAPDEVSAYALLALMFERDQRADLATAVINQMTRVNSEDHEAFLARAGFLSVNRKDRENANRDVDRAVELAPKNEIVLGAAGDFAMDAGKYDRSKMMYDRLLKVNPDNIRGYMGLSRWAGAQNDFNQAIAYLESAVERAPGNMEVLWRRANMELQMNEPDKSEETLRKIEANGAAPWFVNFLEGRIAITRGQWLKATEEFEAARPMVSQFKPEWVLLLDLNLATGYEKLGKHDVRLGVLKRVLDREPDNIAARLQKAQAHAALGQKEPAIRDYEYIRSREMDPTKIVPSTLMAFLELELLKQRTLDESKREWKSAEKLVRAIGQNPAVPRRRYAEIMALYLNASGQKEREQSLRQKLKADNPNSLQYVLEDIMTKSAEPGGFEPAIAELRELRKTKGDVFQFRVLEAQIIAANRPEDMKERLIALESGVESYKEGEKASLLFQLGRFHTALKHYEEAKRVWTQFADLRPTDSNHLIRLYELAIISNDDAGAESAIKRIETAMPKGRESAEWKWARASFVTKKIRSQELPNSSLTEAQALLSEAIAQREMWEPLHRLKGEIHLMSEEFDAAIESYERALELGSDNAEAYRRLVRLYYERRDYQRAKEMLGKLPRAQWEPLDQQINVDIMARLGELPDEVEYDATSTEPNDHLAIGGIMTKAGRFNEAEKAFRRAIELDPSRATTWGSLFELYMKMGEEKKARALLAESEGKVDAENEPMLKGASYHILAEWDKSVAEFKRALAMDPTNVNVMTALSKVYISSGQRENAREILAKMIASEQPNIAKPKRSVAWARRALAEMIAQNSTYEDFKKALKLISDNAPKGALLRPEDMLTYAQISARRPEAITHRETIVKMERTQDERRLSDNELLVLAELYKRQDRWLDCKSVMLDLLTRHSEDARYIVPWLSWLIDKKDFSAARTWVRKVPGDSLPAVRTNAHLLAAGGNVTDAIKAVAGMIPKGRKRTIEDVPQLSALAGILEELGEYDPKGIVYSERIWAEIIKIDSRRTLQMASFYNRRDDEKSAKLALSKCAKSFKLGKDRQLASLQMALYVLRKQYGRLANDPKNGAMVRQLFEQASRDHPASGTALVLRSEFEDLMGNGEDSLKFLRRFLDKEGTHPREKALVQNNLAYKMAWAGNVSGSSELIEESIRVLGPRSDLMDTRGVVQLFEGDPKKAIATFNESIKEGGPSPLKFFHLAYAYWKSGDKSAAVKAIGDAQQMEIDPATMIGGERRVYDDLLREMRSENLIE